MTWHRPGRRSVAAAERRLDDAFAALPRAQFLPEDQRPYAAQDRPLPIGEGQTSSQPSTVRAMLALLDVQAGQRVLDVGAGSGWTTALLARLVGPTGRVVGVELEPRLAEWGAQNLARAGMPWASLEPATEGVLGRPDLAPFDRILVSAMASRLPEELVEQVARPGRMVVPVAGTMLLVVRDDVGEVTVHRHGAYSFVPLR
ncbi:protein-L-isoaspartate O-methyltransferase [Kineosporiaceae bacterium SCSIO 59966]|nr:protein-L-isoaspartate O-methyltransferase [Kineosporiaceae bacterium SCSIO 59966]